MTTDNNDEQLPIDYSPASGAVDPEAAAQDQSESTKTGRHAYTENATFIGGVLPSTSTDDARWADDDDGTDTRYYDTLNQLNRDFATNEFTDDKDGDSLKEKQREHDVRNDIVAWGRQIGLSTPEIDAAIEMMDDLSQSKKRAHGTDTLVLSTLTLAANDQSVATVKSIRFKNGIDTGHTDLTANYDQLRRDLDIDADTITLVRKDIT